MSGVWKSFLLSYVLLEPKNIKFLSQGKQNFEGRNVNVVKSVLLIYKTSGSGPSWA